MAIDIFGFTLSPEVDVGDITGVLALGVSIFTLGFSWVKWRRSRKTLQNEAAKSAMNSIDTSTNSIKEYLWGFNYSALIPVDVSEYLDRLDAFKEDIQDFNDLKDREIKDKKIIQFYKPKVLSALERVKKDNDTFINKAKRPMNEPRADYIDFEKPLETHQKNIDNYISTWKNLD